MTRLVCIVTLLGLLWSVEAHAQTPPPPAPPVTTLQVLSPRPGDAIQGVVDIAIAVPEGSPMAFGGLYFGYAQDASGTRFPIWEADSPRGGTPLTQWDTTSLTDGEYTLYLFIRLENGNRLQATIPDLRVRNYTPIETPTPTASPTAQPGTPHPTATATFTPEPPTPTPLPPNPAALSQDTLIQSVQRAALGVLASFVLLALYRLARGKRF